MLRPLDLCGAHHVPGVERSGRGAAAQAATLRDRLLLSARKVSDRGKLRSVVRTHGRVQREVSGIWLCFPSSFAYLYASLSLFLYHIYIYKI